MCPQTEFSSEFTCAFQPPASLQLLVEEFGGHPPTRPALYDAVYDAVHASVLRGGALQGALFWRYYAAGQEAPRDEGGGAGTFAVTETDPTWFLVVRFAADMDAVGGGGLGSCHDAGPVAPEPTTCQSGCVVVVAVETQ